MPSTPCSESKSPLCANPCDHAFDVHIRSRTIEFIKDLIPHFYTSVGADRVALLSGSTVVSSQVTSPAQIAGYELWHCHFGHISPSHLKSLVELEMVSNLSLPSISSSVPVCPSCMDGKQTRDPFPQSTSHCSTRLELVHSDLHGPLPPTANRFKYWISFTDDASRFRCCWLLHKKSEAFKAFKLYKAWAEKQTGKALKSLQDDKGGKYMSNKWERFMLEHGIERQHTVQATPQQNGVAECTNRILDEGVASLLSDSHFPARFWGEALSCSTAVSGKMPFEAFYSHKPSVSHLHVFGCWVYAHVQKDKCRSFQPKSRKCVFLGYPVDYKGWKHWDPATNEVLISHDVCFVEMEMPGAELGLLGPHYEPLQGVQPGSVGETAGNVPALSVSSPSVPPVDPASTHSDSNSDSGSEADLDDADFVPLVFPDSSPSPSCLSLIVIFPHHLLLHLCLLILILIWTLLMLVLSSLILVLVHILVLIHILILVHILALILVLLSLHLNLSLLCLLHLSWMPETLGHLLLLMSLVLGALVAPCVNGGK